MTKFVAVKTFEAYRLISHARNPLGIAGRGVRIANAMDELSAFIHQTGMRFVTSYLGKDCLESSFGVIGIKGAESANEYLKKADVVLALGTSLPIAQVGYEPDLFYQRQVIIVNIEPPNKFAKPILFIEADLKEFLYEYNQFLRSPQLEY